MEGYNWWSPKGEEGARRRAAEAAIQPYYLGFSLLVVLAVAILVLSMARLAPRDDKPSQAMLAQRVLIEDCTASVGP